VTAALAVAAVLVSAWAVRALRRWLPAAWPRGSQPAVASRGTAGDLEWVERTVAAASHAGEMHWRLRPVLREVAAAGLRRRGVDLDADAAAAQGLLAQGTWELVRPDRPRPDDPFSPGLRPAQLDAVLADLEALLS
jgi:hypothetical protein